MVQRADPGGARGLARRDRRRRRARHRGRRPGSDRPGARQPASQPPQLHGWAEVPFRDTLHEALGRPVLLDKDVIAAVTGEHWAPDGPGDDFVYVYLGSGHGRRGRARRPGASRHHQQRRGDPGAVRPGPTPITLVARAAEAGLLPSAPPDLLRGAAGLRGSSAPWPIATRGPPRLLDDAVDPARPRHRHPGQRARRRPGGARRTVLATGRRALARAPPAPAGRSTRRPTPR